MKIGLLGRAGLKIRAGDGLGEPGVPELLGTPLFYQAAPGDRLTLLDDDYAYAVATYEAEVEPRWLYTYAYAPEQSWTMYRGDLSGKSYRQGEYVFGENVFFRVSLRKMDGGVFDGKEDINSILTFDAATPTPVVRQWLAREVGRVADRVREVRQPGEFAFALLTDTHYTVNGTWGDTLAGIGAMHREVGFDGIIHLGDLTDGMVSGDVTRLYVNTMLTGLKQYGVPVWLALGNHDSNYFRRNPDRFTVREQRDLYLDGRDVRYFVDMPGLRLVVLDSYIPGEALPYGYTRECVEWLEQALSTMTGGCRALVCSHLPPVKRLQYWAKALRGEEELMAVAAQHKRSILAWINGHNHADRLDNDEGFPIVSVANAKCEAFTEHKTEGFLTPERRLGDASQELWDVLLVNAKEHTLRFVRFGAGGDRTVRDGKVLWE